MTKQIIGRTDIVNFPDLNLYNIKVKIDTGAYTSAIHCERIIEEEKVLKCFFHDEKHPNYSEEPVLFTNYSTTGVKSSNGIKENRFKIKTTIQIFGKTYKINLTLSTRDDMRFPVLIGRQFLKRKFLVDVDLENVSFKSITK